MMIRSLTENQSDLSRLEIFFALTSLLFSYFLFLTMPATIAESEVENDIRSPSNYPSMLRGERIDDRRVTIDFRPSQATGPHPRTLKDLRQIFNDIQSYRHQLYHTHGSIHIHEYSTHSKECSCHDPQSTGICEEISQYENELCRKQCVEYVYKIECLSKKKTTFMWKQMEVLRDDAIVWMLT